MSEIFGVLQNNILMLLLFSVGVTAVFYLFKPKQRLYVLAVISLVFYTLCSPKMTVLLLLVVALTFFCSYKITVGKSKKAFLIFGIVPILISLAFFKYFDFFVTELNTIFSKVGIGFSEINIAKILVPIGISYYIFRAVSLLIDTYRGKSEIPFSFRSFIIVFNYITFFPHIICGPIQRYGEFCESVNNSFKFDKELFESGLNKILIGLFMKVVIANRLSGYTSDIFSSPQSYNSIALLCALFFYTVQIYCDFAGYSSIAIGITNLLSIKCSDNFNRPYFSENIRAFWGNWHISLSTWLRDYVYFPLGGSRCSRLRRGVNVIIVFLVSGIWHGAGFIYIFWGIYHGFWNAVTPKSFGKSNGITKWISIIFTDIIVAVGWIFFASPSLGSAFIFIKRIFTTFSINITEIQNAILPFTGDNTCVAFFLVALIFSLIIFTREFIETIKPIKSEIAKIIFNAFMLASVLLFGLFGTSSFIYANF